MKIKLTIALIIIAALVAAGLYLRFGGVTNRQIVDTVNTRADDIKEHIDNRSAHLYMKLDNVEKKLDQLLEIANRPVNDGVHRDQ